MSDESDSLIYPRRIKPDDGKDWTGEIIKRMRRNQKFSEEQRKRTKNG